MFVVKRLKIGHPLRHRIFRGRCNVAIQHKHKFVPSLHPKKATPLLGTVNFTKLAVVDLLNFYFDCHAMKVTFRQFSPRKDPEEDDDDVGGKRPPTTKIARGVGWPRGKFAHSTLPEKSSLVTKDTQCLTHTRTYLKHCVQ